MAVLSITMFIGITLLAHAYGIVPNDTETVVSQIARATFGGRGWPYYAVQAATMAILVLAANTAYADFPRLASIMARDRFLPRQFMNQGDRLAFSNGILILSVLASALLVVFGGDTHALIPLYMIGVFVSFTLSQAGMVIHWRRLREPGWRSSAAINGFGAIVTGIVLVIVAITKAAEGAWIIIVMIPVLVGDFRDHSPPLRSRRSGADAARLAAGTRRAARRDRADRRSAARGRQSAPLRTDVVSGCARGVRGAGSGGNRGGAPTMARMGTGCGAGRPRIAVPIADGAAARLHRRCTGCRPERLRHGDSSGVRAPAALAAPAAQPARADDQRRPAIQAEHRGHQCSVSSRPRNGTRSSHRDDIGRPGGRLSSSRILYEFVTRPFRILDWSGRVMDSFISVHSSDLERDELQRVLADHVAYTQAREFRRFFLTRLGLAVAGAWLLSWPVHLLPHTVFWTLLATMALVIGLTSPSRTHPTSPDTQSTLPR